MLIIIHEGEGGNAKTSSPNVMQKDAQMLSSNGAAGLQDYSVEVGGTILEHLTAEDRYL
jgi:hypothetical protein